ncbi:MAG: Na/Pi cotransporter family protein [Thioclava marina]|uniref:Na/Pi cotransporter family protein n=1 Tax=Thioclava marina TaxID=1915077 RepID=UPI0019C0C6A7|nr:Na/Pi symporter [Thioclava marina]MBC7144011.1 Na/Pi cotransporter family protein [Thioclava marina]
MIWNAVNALGGVGLFLFGMIWLTEGLQGLAGQSLRRVLARFTNTPLSGAVTGAATTALIQSSSATTVTAVGFVSAGLLSFPQALGIIFGANIGTTMTGWLAAILGFKLDLGQITMPLIFLGAFARLFGGARLPLIGTALAGFALIFLGIDVLKSSLSGLEGVLTPADFPNDDLFGRLQLIGIGIVITLVTQSSSAGVTTALALLGAGVINLPQAMALVIGMDVGTTGTAALATLGGSTPARRTGLSHVIYNCLTGVMAFLLLGPVSVALGPQGIGLDGQIALVAFHSGFNILGVVLILPFARPFARLVTLIVRDRGLSLTRSLGKEMLSDPRAAMDAAVSTHEAIAKAQFAYLAHRLRHREDTRDEKAELRDIRAAIAELRSFVEAVPTLQKTDPDAARLSSILHALDHLRRLNFRCAQEPRLATLRRDARLRRLAGLLAGCAGLAAQDADRAALEHRLDRLSRLLRKQREIYRARIVTGGSGRLNAEEMGERLDAMRWLDRVGYHLWRIEYHLTKISDSQLPVSPEHEAAVEVLKD